MQTEFIAVPPAWTVGHAIDYMRDTSDLPDRFYELYVIDPNYRLLEKAGYMKIGRDSDGKTPVSLTPKGEGFLSQLEGVKKSKKDNNDEYAVPLAQRPRA